MKLPRLQSLFWYACALMGAGFLLLGGMLIYHNFSEFKRFSASEAQMERFALVVALANAASAERGPVIGGLRVAPEEQADYLLRIQQLRAQTNDSLQKVNTFLSGEILQDPVLADHLQRFQRELQKARQEADRWLQLSHHIRQRADLSPTIDHLFVAADQAMQLRDGLGILYTMQDPSLNSDIMLSIIGSNMREYAGRLGLYVINLLGDERPELQSAWQKLIETKGRLEGLGHLISNYGQVVSPDSDIHRHVQNLQSQFFDQALPWASRLLDRPRPRLSSFEFLALYVPSLKPLEQLRDSIEQDAFTRIQQQRENAAYTLLVATVITLFVLLFFCYINWLLRFSLFLPLMTAKRQIVALAQDDLNDPAPPRAHNSYELQEMFDGITALRASQKRKQILEHNQKKMAEQLRRLSETDPLTGLYNRRALELVAQAMIKPGNQQRQSIGVILFDIDHFKEINDTYGHALGDVVLQKTSALLMPLMRPGDIFARFGGEEFLVLMPDVSDFQAEGIAEKLRLALSTQLYVDDTSKRPVTASFGVAAAHTEDGDWESLVALADQRMYFSKRRGRNQVTGSSNARD